MDKDLYASLLESFERELEFLEDKPEETPESTLKALWMRAAGEPLSAEAALEQDLPALDADQEETLHALVEQRMQGVPLPHITGRQRFMGIELVSSPAALVPRKETELLGRKACELIAEVVDAQGNALVLDVCTGAGNLPVAYAHHCPQARVCAADLSGEAVDLARQNAAFHSLEERVSFFEGDLLEPFENDEFLGKVDVLTCNPPYISSAKVEQLHPEISEHEPRLAFDGGAFGIKILERLIKGAPALLRDGGHLLFEVGLGQGEGYMQRIQKKGQFSEVQPLRDGNGDIRALWARL